MGESPVPRGETSPQSALRKTHTKGDRQKEKGVGGVTQPKEAEGPTPPLRAGRGETSMAGEWSGRRRSARRWRGYCTPGSTRVLVEPTRPIYGRVKHGTPESGSSDGHCEGAGLALPTPAGVRGPSLEGQHAPPPPLRQEGMRVRVAVHQRQTAPRARDATPNGWRRNNTRRLPACPHDVGAGEHP